MPERLEIYIVYKWRYINTLPFLLMLHIRLLCVNKNFLVTYLMLVQFSDTGVHMFSYNFVESELIYLKSGAL